MYILYSAFSKDL